MAESWLPLSSIGKMRVTLRPSNFVIPMLIAICLCLVACAQLPESEQQMQGPAESDYPTLNDLWEDRAHFTIEIPDTGLPMGESDTVILADGRWRSYLHASHSSLGVLDQCGAPVEFPGCVVIFESDDHGKTFTPMFSQGSFPVCQIACARCPCDSASDHVDQQQYPRVAKTEGVHGENGEWILAYEYRASAIMRRSRDGLTWLPAAELPLSGIWQNELMPCPAQAEIGAHPHTSSDFECLVGGPPGLYIDEQANPPELYLFVGWGQNPGAMGCYRGPLHAPASLMRACASNPLFVGAEEYGPADTEAANHHFDFRTISSADVVRVGDRYYLFYEGVRGPTAGDAGDSQFLLGLARSATGAIDGSWEKFPGNPLMLKLPGNVGVGHADVVIADGVTYLYTTLDGSKRSRLRLVWR